MIASAYTVMVLMHLICGASAAAQTPALFLLQTRNDCIKASSITTSSTNKPKPSSSFTNAITEKMRMRKPVLLLLSLDVAMSLVGVFARLFILITFACTLPTQHAAGEEGEVNCTMYNPVQRSASNIICRLPTSTELHRSGRQDSVVVVRQRISLSPTYVTYNTLTCGAHIRTDTLLAEMLTCSQPPAVAVINKFRAQNVKESPRPRLVYPEYLIFSYTCT